MSILKINLDFIPEKANSHSFDRIKEKKITSLYGDEKIATHLEGLARETSTISSLETDLEEGQFEEVLDIASAVYYGRISEAKRLFNQLLMSRKEWIIGHMFKLKGTLFEDRFKTLQALFVTANEMVGNTQSYPSQELIDEIFIEMKTIMDSA